MMTDTRPARISMPLAGMRQAALQARAVGVQDIKPGQFPLPGIVVHESFEIRAGALEAGLAYQRDGFRGIIAGPSVRIRKARNLALDDRLRSEEHTSELQSQSNLVCRLLLEKKTIYRLTSVALS